MTVVRSHKFSTEDQCLCCGKIRIEYIQVVSNIILGAHPMERCPVDDEARDVGLRFITSVSLNLK